MGTNFFFNAMDLWKGIVYNTDQDKLNVQLEAYRKLFSLFQIGEHYHYVFNFGTMQCEYLSSSIEKVLGYTSDLDMRSFMDRIHPEDSVHYLNFENAAISFLKELPYEKLGKYKIQYDFRVKNVQGEYVRILHQSILVHFDEEKNFFRSMAFHTDISHIKRNGIPCLSFIGIDGEPSFIDVKAPSVIKSSTDLLTKREKEILRFIIAGKTSEEIAETLFISLHTVNTHRRNILSKSGSRSLIELIGLAIENGWV